MQLRRSLIPRLAAACWFIALSLAVTWPLALHLKTHFFGNEGTADLSIFLWNLWWAKEAVVNSTNPLWTPMLYYPQGISLAYHTLSLPQGLLALPWSLQNQCLLAYNLVTLASLASSGFAMTLLARSFTDRWLPATFAGTAFLLAPNYVVHVASAHLNLFSWQWALLACWAFLRLASKPSWPWAVAFGTFAALSLYTDLLFGVFLALLLPALYLTKHGPHLPSPAQLATMALGLLLALLLLAPLLRGLVTGYPQVAASAPWVTPQERLVGNAPDLSYFLLPMGGTDAGLATYRSFLPQGLTQPPKGSENRAFVGGAPLLLALIGFVRHRRAWPLLLLAAGSALIALGPQVRLSGREVLANPPFTAFHSLPLIAFSRTPGRFLFLVTLSLSILAALSLTSGKPLLPSRRPSPGAMAAPPRQRPYDGQA